MHFSFGLSTFLIDNNNLSVLLFSIYILNTVYHSQFVVCILNDLYRFELALQQNETLDVFTDDYLELGEEDSTFGSNSDNHLKVSFGIRFDKF